MKQELRERYAKVAQVLTDKWLYYSPHRSAYDCAVRQLTRQAQSRRQNDWRLK